MLLQQKRRCVCLYLCVDLCFTEPSLLSTVPQVFIKGTSLDLKLRQWMKHESSTQANRHVLTKPTPTPHSEWTVTFWWFDSNYFTKPKTVINVKHHDESYSHVLESLRLLETSLLSHLMLDKLILSRFTFLWYEKLWWVSYQSKGTSATQKSSYKVHSQATILVKTVFLNNWHNLQNEQ